MQQNPTLTRDPPLSISSCRRDRRRAAVLDARQHVPVLPVQGEAIVHLAIAGPLVLVEKGRVVERCELYEAVVHLPVDAPSRNLGGEVAQVAATAPDHDVDGAGHGARVVGLLRARAFFLQILALACIHLEETELCAGGIGATYLIDRACPLVVVDMAVERHVHPVLLPELLEAMPGSWLGERPVYAIEETRRVPKDAMSDEYQPWLLLPVDRGEAVLDELVLLCAFPPVMLAVRDAEPEHAIIC